MCTNYLYFFSLYCGAHGSVAMCVIPVTEKSLVQTPLWSLDALVTPGGVMTFIRLAARKSGISTGQMHLHGKEKDLTLTYFSLYYDKKCNKYYNVYLFPYHIVYQPSANFRHLTFTFAVILDCLADWWSFPKHYFWQIRIQPILE